MKAGPFAFVVATALRLDPKSFAVVSRLLKEGGLVSTGARGVNAPEMNDKDLAMHVLAALATDKPARAVELVQRIGKFQLSQPDMVEAVASLLPDPDHTLADLLTLLCSPKVKVPSEFEITVSVVGQAMVNVTGGGWTLVYVPRDEIEELTNRIADVDIASIPAEVADQLFNHPMSLHGIKTIREVNWADIEFIKGLVFQEAA